ncbi:hypothetical protein RB213_003264 [Colletotrichum asianum]
MVWRWRRVELQDLARRGRWSIGHVLVDEQRVHQQVEALEEK